MNRRLFVWLTVSPEREDDFNRWYEEEYIPRFVRQVPGIEAVSRWKMDGSHTYVTVYELTPGADFDEAVRAWGSAERAADRDEWQRWEDEHLGQVLDGYFFQTFELDTGAGAGQRR